MTLVHSICVAFFPLLLPLFVPLNSSHYLTHSAPPSLSYPHLYVRQSTADSVFSTDSTDTDSSWGTFACKRNIELEEAEDLARVRSMEVQDVPHPSLSLAPFTAEVLIHVQASGKNRDVS